MDIVLLLLSIWHQLLHDGRGLILQNADKMISGHMLLSQTQNSTCTVQTQSSICQGHIPMTHDLIGLASYFTQSYYFG